MARFAYDVNTRTRLIDVHKQFNGGLKTVDTDDALGSVYLRQAENVSLSEFGFIEKRYGTIEKDLIKETNDTLQGYWHYFGFDIYAINNKFYYRNSAGTETAVSQIFEENNTYRYPTLPTYDGSGFGAATEENPYRDMGAVNINNVLYIFTGFYPVYVKLVNDVPKFYWFSVTIPTYDEIVVTGHNLLEDNYNGLYFKNKTAIQYSTPGTTGEGYGDLTRDLDNPPFMVPQQNSDGTEIKQHAPLLPYQDAGVLDFNFRWAIDSTYLQAYNSSSQPRVFIMDVENIGYRVSGPGSTDYINVDRDAIDFNKLHNYTGSSALTATFESPFIGPEGLTTNYTGTLLAGGNTNPNNDDFVFNTLLLNAVSPQAGQVASIVYDVNTEKSGADFVGKEGFTPGDTFEFRLLRQTNDANNPTAPMFIPTTTDEVEDDYFTDWAEQPEDVVGTPSPSWTIYKQVAPKIRIVPVGAENQLFEAQQLVIKLDEGLTKTTSGYKFTVPATITDNSNIVGYNISLRGEFIASFSNVTADVGENTTSNYIPSGVINKELIKIEPLERGTNNEFNLTTSKNIGVTLTNLLAGTYDFRITYRLQKYTLNSDDFLEIIDDDDGIVFSDIHFYNVTITSEKLQDLPGITTDFLPRLKPIWTCNKVMEHYGKLMVWGSKEMPTALFYSFPDRPTYFPSKFYLDFTNDTNQPLEAVTPYMNILVAQTASQTFGIRGNSGLIDAPAPYAPFGINGTVGTIAYKSVRPVRNHLFFLSKQGVIALKSLYAADEQYNIEFVDRNIRNIVPQDSKAVGIQFDNQYWLNFPEDSITLRWYIDKKAWVQDIYQGWSDFKGVFKYQIVDGKLEFITHPSTKDEENANKTIYKIGVDVDIPTDIFAPIKAKFETAFLNQNYPFHQKNYKEAKLDFTIQNEYNLGREDFYDSTQDTMFNADSGQGDSTISITVPQPFERNHRYRIAFTMDADNTSITHLPLSSISIEGETSYVTGLTPVGDANNTLVWEFNITNDYQEDATSVDFFGSFTSEDGRGVYSLIITDVTYDDELTFSTYVISEDTTLNFDNYSGYNQATADVDLDLKLKGRLGDWTFGESDFGKKVTAVKTIKLSGKGYNAKLYLEDTSKSKWTLESLGLTYKMKRARSR